MIRQPPRTTLSSSSAASDVYKRQVEDKAKNMEIEDVLDACCETPRRKKRGPHHDDREDDDENSTIIITLAIVAVAVVVGIGAVLFMCVYRPGTLMLYANSSTQSTKKKEETYRDENTICEREMALNIDEHNNNQAETI
eukprot:TRINITY_DN22603_c0_g1_i1.p1 TRINITY_DN22603_c0_g1~~TRINITY_DN22603_c0_g1_i1.p1  ORF type:complete len:139 (+),score=29.37 TRINITY_DN22603_c0_g1_i1:89-505(+)